jgi:GABA(A) receptor-associated protein
MTTFTYDTSHTFEERVAEANRVLARHPDRIPVLVQKDNKSDVPDIDKCKYLVPKDLTMGQFVYVIRKRLKNFTSEKALFVFVNNALPSTNTLVSVIYDKHKSPDNFLRMIYSTENTFGQN